MKRLLYIVAFALLALQPLCAVNFFYRVGDRVDRFLVRRLDTAYIQLPEHSWRLALNTAVVGVNSTITSTTESIGDISLHNRLKPGVNLGFFAGYRSLGFGYSWDLRNAYSRQLNFSLGSKFIGIDFSLQKSANTNTSLQIGEYIGDIASNNVAVTNANLTFWYAVNYPRYSHQAAIKQSYIQRTTAGSPMLFLSYMSSMTSLSDTLSIVDAKRPLLPSLMSGMTSVQTRQLAVGFGYGINYTPNKGKVLLHASAALMLVVYSVNHASYYLDDSIANWLPGEPMFNLKSSAPVHLTGNVRAAVSWEINKWVHLSAWATGEHIRFRSEMTPQLNYLSLSNWNWKVQVSIGVRLGAGRERVRKALEKEGIPDIQSMPEVADPMRKQLPRWVKDFFFTPPPL